MRLCLIGKNIQHSLSPQVHAEIAQKNGRSVDFELVEVDNLREFMCETVWHYDGVAVTSPYKKEIYKYGDLLSQEVSCLKCSNTVKVNSHRFELYNTDVTGFQKSFTPFFKKWDRITIVGNGGAAQSVIRALSNLGVDIWGYSAFSSLEIRSEFNQEWITESQVIINCSPVGGPSSPEDSPISADKFKSCRVAFDLNYIPYETGFLRAARLAGVEKRKNGFEMLRIQAEEQQKIWFDGR